MERSDLTDLLGLDGRFLARNWLENNHSFTLCSFGSRVQAPEVDRRQVQSHLRQPARRFVDPRLDASREMGVIGLMT